jgi:dihydroorotate dehydrogenase (fumarate)
VGEDYRGRFLRLVTDAKAQTSVPIIASINCIGAGARWIDYAKELATAGADALEINLFTLATDRHVRSEQIEEEYQYVVRRICAAVKIPVSVKLPLRLTAPINVVDRLWGVGARGVVLHNRPFEPDVDTDSLNFKASSPFSEVVELRNSLRWVALCTRVVPQVDVAVSTGVHSGVEAVKALLCGARAVQVCTAIQKGGYEAINEINQAINAWGREHGFRTIEEFRGRVAEPPNSEDDLLLRTQYMRYFPKG